MKSYALAEESKTAKTTISSEWELDCFSRPVLVEGKKLWEVLVTDSSGQWREVVQLPASDINSVSVRGAIESIIERAPVKPSVIRFFRRQMVNMLSISLSGVAKNRPNLRVVPSRSTHALFAWLDERNDEVYSKMEGYDAKLIQKSLVGSGLVQAPTAGRLPEGLRGEKYAFVTLPLSEVFPGGSITEENIGVGKLIDPIPIVPQDSDSLAPTDVVPGLVLFTRRPDALAMAVSSIELAAIRADTSTRQVIIDVGLDETYLLARLTDDQRAEAAAFERDKALVNGLHFLVVQSPDDDDADPSGFWLLREIS